MTSVPSIVATAICYHCLKQPPAQFCSVSFSQNELCSLVNAQLGRRLCAKALFEQHPIRMALHSGINTDYFHFRHFRNSPLN